MNDERNGQLSAGWLIPAYARDMLWLETDMGDMVQAEGEYGLFSLEIPAPLLTVRWGAEDGPALVRLHWQADTLGWEGQVSMGGYIDALHITEIDGLPYPIAVAVMGGQILNPGALAYPTAAHRRQVPYAPPDFDDALSDAGEDVSTWLISDESPLAGLAQDALVSKLPVHVFGRLADESGGWHRHFALPLLLEAVTLFAP